MDFWQTLGQLITLRVIATLLLFLSLLWFLKLMMKKQIEHLLRAALIFVFLFLIFIFFQRSEIGSWNVFDLKDSLFPEKVPTLSYRLYRGPLEGDFRLRYVFKEPRPKLALTLDKGGKSLHLWNVSSVNAVLKGLDLPRIHHGVPELSSITGSRSDRRHYRWGDYPLGILTIERELCQYRNSLQSYNCIATLTIRSR